MANLNLPGMRTFIGDAAVWKRIFAFILDIIIADFFIFSGYDTILRKISGGSTIAQLSKTMQSSESLYTGAILLFLLMVLFLFAYFVLLEYLIGQTPGKMAFGLRTVSTKGADLSLPSFWQCVLRSLFVFPVIPFILLWIVDPIYLLWKKERLSEWASKTKVISVQIL